MLTHLAVLQQVAETVAETVAMLTQAAVLQ
jgi:hypothetical protein